MKIMVGYDGSDAAEAALNVAIQHARVFQAQLIMVRSLKGGTVTEKIETEYAEEDLGKAKKRVEAEGLACEAHLLPKNLTPGEDLVTFARENGIDEIVIGVRRRSKAGKLFFGSNAQYVILKAPCAVVSVH